MDVSGRTRPQETQGRAYNLNGGPRPSRRPEDWPNCHHQVANLRLHTNNEGVEELIAEPRGGINCKPGVYMRPESQMGPQWGVRRKASPATIGDALTKRRSWSWSRLPAIRRARTSGGAGRRWATRDHGSHNAASATCEGLHVARPPPRSAANWQTPVCNRGK